MEEEPREQPVTKNENSIRKIKIGNYIKKEYSGQVNKTNDVRIVEKVVEKDVDIATLAEAMAKALLNHFPQGVQGQQGQYQSFKNKPNKPSDDFDDFDDSKTLEGLAKSMLVSRNETESNMGDMSRHTVETKRDDKETNGTIDLLSNLDD